MGLLPNRISPSSMISSHLVGTTWNNHFCYFCCKSSISGQTHATISLVPFNGRERNPSVFALRLDEHTYGWILSGLGPWDFFWIWSFLESLSRNHGFRKHIIGSLPNYYPNYYRFYLFSCCVDWFSFWFGCMRNFSSWDASWGTTRNRRRCGRAVDPRRHVKWRIH